MRANRVVLHLDADCWYCQVEQKRLNIPTNIPCAVQQWAGLIAVNYAARERGITRHMRVAEAKARCPELRLVHVQTVGAGPDAPTAAATAAAAAAAGGGGGGGGGGDDDDEEHEGHAPSTAAGAGATAGHLPTDLSGGAVPASGPPPAAAAAAEVEGSAGDRQSSKASLQRYRHASAEVMQLLAALSPGCPFEKASIDEAYIDVTTLAVQELAAAEAAEGGAAELLARAAEGSIVLGGGEGDDGGGSGFRGDTDYDRLAAAGAVIALRLRAALRERLSYTCSAGIAPNKLLAKIASAMNKPNKQTVVLPRAVEGLMRDLPLGKVKGLGGKLGAKLEAVGAATTGAAAGLSWEVLVDTFGSKARWVWETVRGCDDEAVTPKSLVKSINACKSFAVTSSPAVVSRWLGVLAAELAERLTEDEDDHCRRPRTLVLQYRTSHSFAKNVPDRSIRGPLPGSSAAKDSPSADSLVQTGEALFRRIVPAPFPLTRLALAATDFVELRGSSNGSSAAMARFLAAGAQQQQQQQQQQEAGEEGAQPGGRPAAPPMQQSAQQQQQQQQHHAKQRHRQPHGKQSQQQQQAHLEHFFGSRAAPQQAGAGAAQHHQVSLAQQQQQHTTDPLQQVHQHDDDPHEQQQQQHQQQQQQDQCAPDSPSGGQQEQAGPDPQGEAAAAAGAGQLQQQEQQQEQEQQQQQGEDEAVMSAAEVAALAGVDLAEQARLLAEIQGQGVPPQQRHHGHGQQQLQPRGGQPAAGKKRKTTSQGRKPQDSKQRSISSMFSSKQG